MPIYAYRCEGCGFQKDALQKLSDLPLLDCPQCDQPRLVKQVTAAGFALKGTGWYATDFRDQGRKPTAPAANSEGAAPTVSQESSTGAASEATGSTPVTPSPVPAPSTGAAAGVTSAPSNAS